MVEQIAGAYADCLQLRDVDRLPRYLDALCDIVGCRGCALFERQGALRQVRMARRLRAVSLAADEMTRYWRALERGNRTLDDVVGVPLRHRDLITGERFRAALAFPSIRMLSEPRFATARAFIAASIAELLDGADRTRAAAMQTRLAAAPTSRAVSRDWLYRVARTIRDIHGFDGEVALLACDDRGALSRVAYLRPRGHGRHPAKALAASEVNAMAPSLSRALHGLSAAGHHQTPAGEAFWTLARGSRGLRRTAIDASDNVSRLVERLAAYTDGPSAATVAVPLWARDDLLGFVVLSGPERGSIREAHVRAMLDFAPSAAAAMDRERQFDLELTYLAAAALRVSSDGDGSSEQPSGPVLRLLAQRVRRNRSADVVGILPYDPGAAGFRVIDGFVDPPDAHELLSLDDIDGMSVLITTGELEWHSAAGDEQCFPFARASGVQSAMSVLLRSSEDNVAAPVGLLCVGFRRARSIGATAEGIPPAVSDRDRREIRFYSDIAARHLKADASRWRRQAIDAQVRRLYQRLSERELEAVDGDGSVSGEIGYYPLLREILLVALELVGGTAGVIAVPCNEHADLQVLVAEGLTDDRLSHIAYGAGVTGAAAQRREPIVIEDVQDPSTWPADVQRLPWVHGSRAEMAVPLLGGADQSLLLGVLDVESQIARGAFGQVEEEVLRHLAQAASLALELQRVIFHLRALRDLTRSIDTATTRNSAATSALREAMRVTGAYAGSVRLLDPTGAMLDSEVHLGVRGIMADQSLPVGGPGVAPWVVKHRRTCYIADTSDQATIAHDHPGLEYISSRPRTASELAVPLEWYRQMHGVLNLEHVQPHGLAASRDFVAGVADQLASALYRERRQSQAIRGREEGMVSSLVQLSHALGHDLRTRFTGILDECAKLDEDSVDERIRATVRRILLLASQGEQDAYGFLEHAADPISSPVPVRIGDVISEVVADLVQATLTEPNRPRVGLAVQQEARDAVIWCRRGLLGWSFRKVIDNSCTYAGDAPHIRIALDLDGPSIRLEVSDNGPGLSAADAAELFRWDRPRIRAHGSGFALPIVGSVIAALGGVVRAEPGVPHGLRTVFYLPRQRDDSQ